MKSKGQILILTIFITAVSACGKDQAPSDDLTKDTMGIVETQVTQWFYLQQLPNGLLESVENSMGASLYDNALGAMVFMLQNDYEKAEKIFDFFNARIDSELNAGIGGFPYASNPGTHYGDGLLWNSADKEIAISGGAWYVFTKRKFNPFAVGRDKNIPREDMFWMD